MKPELQVCSFEQADKLYQMGIAQGSLYYYIFFTSNPDLVYLNPKKHATKLYAHALNKYGDDSIVEIRSAFNIAELAELLDLKEGVFDAVALADLLLAKLNDGTLLLDEVNERYLSAT